MSPKLSPKLPLLFCNSIKRYFDRLPSIQHFNWFDREHFVPLKQDEEILARGHPTETEPAIAVHIVFDKITTIEGR